MSQALRLHVLAASGRLELHRRAMEDRIADAFSAAAELLKLGEDDVDVVVRDAPGFAVPELGIGGVAPDAHTIFVNVDSGHPKLADTIRNELPRTIAHELHHVARRREGCRGTTLWDAIVHEGLADHFSIELCGGDPPPWSVALSEAALDRFTKAALEERDSDSYDHGVWFLGRKPAVTPRWAGYAVGWRVVGDHLHHHPDEPASALTGLPADRFRWG